MLKYDSARLRIVDYIRRSHLRPGDPIPSQNTLVKYCNCSLITVKRALSDLRKSGLIECGQGRTARLRRNPDRQTDASGGTILMIQIYRRYPDTESQRHLLQMYLAERGFRFDYRAVMLPSDLADQDFTGVTGIIFYGWLSEEWADLAERLKIPAVVAGNNLCPDRLPTVHFDYEQGTELLFDALRSAGCRKIGLIAGEPEYPSNQAIRQAWLQCMTKAGSADPAPYLCALPGLGKGGGDRILRDFLHQTDADGLILSSPRTILWTMTHLLDFDPPRDIKLGLHDFGQPLGCPRRNSFFAKPSGPVLPAATDELIAATMEMRPVRSLKLPLELVLQDRDGTGKNMEWPG